MTEIDWCDEPRRHVLCLWRSELKEIYRDSQNILNWNLLSHLIPENYMLWKDEVYKALGLAGFTKDEAWLLFKNEGDIWAQKGFFDYGFLEGRFERVDPTFESFIESAVGRNISDAVWSLIQDYWPNVTRAAKERDVPITPKLYCLPKTFYNLGCHAHVRNEFMCLSVEITLSLRNIFLLTIEIH